MTTVDRRQFLIATAGAAGALLAGGGVASAGGGPAGPARARAATYRTLVQTLRSAPDGRFRDADPATAARRFARWYARQPAAVRGHADTVLDDLGARGVPDCAALGGTPRSRRDAADARRRATLAAAVDLACVSCEPPPGEDERPDHSAPGAHA